jgi:hypothetical protein
MGLVVLEAEKSKLGISRYLSNNGFLLPDADLVEVDQLIQEALEEKQRDNELVAKMQAKEKENDPNWMPVPDGYTRTHSTPTHELISQYIERFYSEKAVLLQSPPKRPKALYVEFTRALNTRRYDEALSLLCECEEKLRQKSKLEEAEQRELGDFLSQIEKVDWTRLDPFRDISEGPELQKCLMRLIANGKKKWWQFWK